MKNIILASSSRFRKDLLSKLQLPFSTASPDIDENAKPNESTKELVQRLSIEKAYAVAKDHANALIIGSDELADVDGKTFGKPMNHANAVDQLKHASGKTMRFYTGLSLLDTQSQQIQVCVETYDVKFRQLSLSMIEKYLHAEKPYQSAGSIKSEGLAVALFESMRGDDFNALIGLPLIQLVTMLKNVGVEVL